MSESRRRALLYGVAILAAAGMLFAGFGITVPPDPGTHLNGATLLAGLGQYDEALAVCSQVLEDHPDSVDARVFRATFLAMAKRHDEALAAFDDALAHAEDEELRLNLMQDRAGVLLDAGRQVEFEKERERLVAMGAEDSVLLLDGVAAVKRKEWALAIRSLLAAQERQPDNDRIRARLWNAYMEKGREALAAGEFAEARDAFDGARPLFVRASQAHLKAIEVRLAMDDIRDALEIIREVGPNTPGAAPLVFRASVGLLANNDVEGALDALDAAYSLDPVGTRALLERESAWKAHRDHDVVRFILETDPEKVRAGLTPGE